MVMMRSSINHQLFHVSTSQGKLEQGGATIASKSTIS
jgi:hypothetical protein